MENAKTIFISYKAKDCYFAEKLRPPLTDLGYKLWFDAYDEDEDDEDDEDFSDEIGEVLSYSIVFIAILSSKNCKSKKLKSEVKLTLSKRIPIFPLLLQDIDISEWKIPYENIDFSDEAEMETSFSYFIEKVKWVCSDRFQLMRKTVDHEVEKTKKKNPVFKQAIKDNVDISGLSSKRDLP